MQLTSKSNHFQPSYPGRHCRKKEKALVVHRCKLRRSANIQLYRQSCQRTSPKCCLSFSILFQEQGPSKSEGLGRSWCSLEKQHLPNSIDQYILVVWTCSRISERAERNKNAIPSETATGSHEVRGSHRPRAADWRAGLPAPVRSF